MKTDFFSVKLNFFKINKNQKNAAENIMLFAEPLGPAAARPGTAVANPVDRPGSKLGAGPAGDTLGRC
jgi:hypothetical protein